MFYGCCQHWNSHLHSITTTWSYTVTGNTVFLWKILSLVHVIPVVMLHNTSNIWKHILKCQMCRCKYLKLPFSFKSRWATCWRGLPYTVALQEDYSSCQTCQYNATISPTLRLPLPHRFYAMPDVSEGKWDPFWPTQLYCQLNRLSMSRV